MKKLPLDDCQTPDGFYYFPDFITREEEDKLLREFKNFTWQEVKMHGIIAKRRVMHFGLDYTYTTRSATPTIPIPVYLIPFIERAAKLLNIDSHEIVEVLITEYPIGAAIGWHRDAPIFGDKIFGISLGGSCVFKIRMATNNKYNVYKTELKPCSAYILSRAARTIWEHSILAVKELRYSITFRTLKNKSP